MLVPSSGIAKYKDIYSTFFTITKISFKLLRKTKGKLGFPQLSKDEKIQVWEKDLEKKVPQYFKTDRTEYRLYLLYDGKQ